VLPHLEEAIPYSASKPLSCHLFGRGIDVSDAVPTIKIITKKVPSKEEQIQWRDAIIMLFPEDLRTGLAIQFQLSALRRTGVQGQNLPPVCEAKNVSFSSKPLPGSSIGIAGYTDQTATLGGYIKVNEGTHILTVHHLLPDHDYDSKTGLLNGERPSLTQASAQESADRRFTEHLDEICLRMQKCCAICTSNWKKIYRRDKDSFLESLYMYDRTRLQNLAKDIGEQCSLAQEAILTKLAEHAHKAYHFGRLEITSGFRSRQTCTTDSYMVEMDWALYRPLPSRIGFNSDQKTFRFWRTWNEVIPGAEVYSVGRTSGYQKGMINSSMSYVDFGDHATREWAVIKLPSTEDEAWVESGIGVDGDSGAWIIDYNTNRLYGMLWGRHGEGAETLTYFTPIVEIIADIKEKMGDVEICLP